MGLTFEDFIFCIGWAGFTGLIIVMYLTFFAAYFNNYEVLVTINHYGEAHIEMVMFILLMPCIIYFAHHSLRNYVLVNYK